MAEREINDFVVMLADNMDAELDTFHLFTLQADPKVKNRRIILSLQAVDVPVRRSGGFYFFKALTGQPLVANKVELDKRREVSVGQNFFLLVKAGKPNVYAVFPDDFDQLPQSLKEHSILGALFKMMYLAVKSNQLKEEIMAEAGIQASEIEDILSQSQTRLSETMMKMVQDWTQATENQLKQNKGAPPQTQPKEGNTGYY